MQESVFEKSMRMCLDNDDFNTCYFKKIKEEEDKKIKYIESNEFAEDFKELKDFLELSNKLSTDCMFSFETSTTKLEEKLIKIVDSLLASGLDAVVDEDCDFYRELFNFEGINFSVMQGQGTIIVAKLLKTTP